MFAKLSSRWGCMGGLLIVLLACAARAEAGPPLLCDPFRPEPGAALLPWAPAPTSWNAPDPDYDRRQLVGDVLRLLTPQASILARMENLRRATIYATADPRLAGELLAAVTARTTTAAGEPSRDPLAWFDAGYLIETYRQASHIARWDMLTGDARRMWTMNRAPSADGVALVRQAIALSGSNRAMEHAMSLMR